MKEEYLYFEHPTQVKFIDMDRGSEEPHWLGGIAYKDEIICGCCGGVFDIKEYYDDWHDFGHKDFPDIENPIETYNYWVDFNEEIKD